jgi:hypothetical protein
MIDGNVDADSGKQAQRSRPYTCVTEEVARLEKLSRAIRGVSASLIPSAKPLDRPRSTNLGQISAVGTDIGATLGAVLRHMFRQTTNAETWDAPTTICFNFDKYR